VDEETAERLRRDPALAAEVRRIQRQVAEVLEEERRQEGEAGRRAGSS